MRKGNEPLAGVIFDLFTKGIFIGLGLILMFSMAFESVWVQR